MSARAWQRRTMNKRWRRIASEQIAPDRLPREWRTIRGFCQYLGRIVVEHGWEPTP